MRAQRDRSPRTATTLRGATAIDQRRYGGYLGGLYWTGAGLVTLITLPVASDDVHRAAASVLCIGLILIGLLLPTLPWQRWSQRALLVIPVAGQVVLGLAGAVVPHAVAQYAALVILSYAHAGLTQRPGVSLKLLPFTVAALAVAWRDAWSVNVIIVVPIGVGLCEVLAAFRRREHRTRDDLAALLRATRRLMAATTLEDAARLLANEMVDMLGADFVHVYTADPDDRLVLVNRAPDPSGPALRTHTTSESSGVGTTLRTNQSLFIADVTRSDVASPRLHGAAGAVSMVYYPLSGRRDPVGVLAIGWKRPHRPPDPTAQQILEILSSEAGRVIERLDHTAQLTSDALTDPLTGAGNRRQWNRELDQLDRNDAVVLVDLDHFKQVNDNHGHDHGDRVLVELTSCLRDAARRQDAICRLGGDEFGVVLRDADAHGVAAYVERVHRRWGDAALATTFSAGWAAHDDRRAPAATVEAADAALLKAKRLGRGRTVGPLVTER